MRAEGVHGDLTQDQVHKQSLLLFLSHLQSQNCWLKSLMQLFRDGAVNFLMATDHAPCGLDIKGIETLVNYDMPGKLARNL